MGELTGGSGRCEGRDPGDGEKDVDDDCSTPLEANAGAMDDMAWISYHQEDGSCESLDYCRG